MSGIPRTHKKLREAKFFFAQLLEKEKSVRLGLEDFDFYLSAFLSASCSVSWVLRAELLQAVQDKRKKNQLRKRFDKWFSDWEMGLAETDQKLWGFMPNERGKEVHARGAEVYPVIEMVPVTQIQTRDRRHPAYGITWWGPPGVPPPEVGQKVHYFEMGGTREQVVGTCRRYLELLEKLVRDFDNAFPS